MSVKVGYRKKTLEDITFCLYACSTIGGDSLRGTKPVQSKTKKLSGGGLGYRNLLLYTGEIWGGGGHKPAFPPFATF